MMQDVGRAIGNTISMMAIVLVVSVPLGLWKLIEIIIWVVKHVKVSIAG